MTTKISKHDKVIRLQADKLCKDLGYKPGTKIDIETIRMIASGTFADVISIDGQPTTLTMHMIGVAQILLKKIEGGN